MSIRQISTGRTADRMVLDSNSAGAGTARNGRIEFSCHELVNSSKDQWGRRHLCVRDTQLRMGLGDYRRRTDFGTTCVSSSYPSLGRRFALGVITIDGYYCGHNRCAFVPRDPWKRRKTTLFRPARKGVDERQSRRRVCPPRLFMPLVRPAKRLSRLYFTGSFGNVNSRTTRVVKKTFFPRESLKKRVVRCTASSGVGSS